MASHTLPQLPQSVKSSAGFRLQNSQSGLPSVQSVLIGLLSEVMSSAAATVLAVPIAIDAALGLRAELGV